MSPDIVDDVVQVKFYPRGDESNVSNKLTAERHVVFTALRPRTDYGFQVRAKTAHGWGEYSPTIYKTTGQLLGSGKNTQQQVQRKTGNKDDTGNRIVERNNYYAIVENERRLAAAVPFFSICLSLSLRVSSAEHIAGIPHNVIIPLF